MWICTVGTGLWVYNGSTRQPIANWGEEEKQQIYTLLYVEETSSILALTHKGMFIFKSDLGPPSSVYQMLNPTVSIPKSGVRDLNEGIVISPGGNVETTQVWVCSQTVLGFCVLDPREFTVVDEVKVPASDGHSHKIRHMTTTIIRGRSVLIVADRHYIQPWDVQKRQRQDVFDCSGVCKEIYGDNGKFLYHAGSYKRTHKTLGHHALNTGNCRRCRLLL